MLKSKKKKEDKEDKKEEVVVDRQNPAFDPDIPEQKQRWLR